MKFKFTKKILIRKSTKKERKLVIRKAENLFPSLYHALQRNEQIDLFGVFDESNTEKNPIISRMLPSIKKLCRKILAVIRTILKRQYQRPVPRASLAVGAICGVLVISMISGAITLVALFGKYAGKYSTLTVPNLISLSESEAVSFQNDVFEYDVVYRYNPSEEAGKVILQSPQPNVTRRLYDKNGKIKLTLTVSAEREEITLPSLRGMNTRDAELILKNLGLEVITLEEYSQTVPSGKVILCSHSEGTALRVGERVVLRSSKGGEPIYVKIPDLSGLGEAEASDILHSLGLVIEGIKYKASGSPLGTVIYQEYEKGTSLLLGTKVSITVSGGKYFEENIQ